MAKSTFNTYSIDTIEDKTKTRVELLDEIYEGIVILYSAWRQSESLWKGQRKRIDFGGCELSICTSNTKDCEAIFR